MDDEQPSPPEYTPKQIEAEGWQPKLNPEQRKIFDSFASYVLAFGEKGCRTSDALIYTNDGIKRLGSLKPDSAKPGRCSPIKQRIISFDGCLCDAEADGFWVEPDDEAIRVDLANGAEITGSPRHPLWTCWQNVEHHGFGYKSLSEIQNGIKSGWRFWTPMLGHPQWVGSRKSVCGFEITPGLAYAIGALVGDGSLNISTGDGRSAHFTNSDMECISAVSEGLAEIGCNLSKGPRYQYTLLENNGIVKKVIQSLKIDKLSYFKRIPDEIIESPVDVVCAFLSGLFDTDGSVEKTGLVSFCTVSGDLSRDVQDVLACLGILCVRRPKKSASGRPTWTLSIMGRHARRVGDLVGFRIKRKQDRISKPKISHRNPHGFNHNRYSYPDTIRRDMRRIALDSRTDARKPKHGVVHRDRAWHNAHRRLHSFGSVPSSEKVMEFCLLYECRQKMVNYFASDVWLEIASASETKAGLFDLHVPGTHSFLASGTINHNSGKSIGGLHSMVRHCFEEMDALALIIAPQIRTGKEGVIYDLQWVLDIWKNGNKDGDDNRIDEGIDLEYTEPSLDPQTKDRVLYIGNRHGGWSKVILISIPYAEVVEKRMKALSPSFVYVDEITELESIEYFTYVSAQIGRRRGIKGPQQYVASCNPAGPSHWVYKVFFEDCVNQESGERDPAFEIFHVPITENAHNLPAGYVDNLKRIFRDPIDQERLLLGKWVDRATGEAIFKNYYRPEIHRRGNVHSREGLMPHKGYPIIVGHDPGPVNYSGHFMQMIPVKGGQVIWIVFDELNLVGERRPDFYVVPEILAKMEKWNTYLGGQANFIHIADEAAFSHVRPDGSYDAMRIQQLSGGVIRMRSCPKGKDSVAARVRMTTSMLLDQSLFVSALCPKTHEMFQMLVSEKPKGDKYDDEGGFRPKRSRYIHPLDSMTYPIYYFRLLPAAFVLQTSTESSVFRAGGT